jgi:beta-glucosidase-like glycosyl hydrolase
LLHFARNDEQEISPLPLKAPRQKFAAMTEPFLVDAMADSGGEVPLNRNIERSQTLRRLKQSLRRNEVVAIAMDQENGRAGFDLGGKAFRV